MFGGTPLTDRIPESERFCGVQVLDVSTGTVVGAVRFETGVNEIFAVQVLPAMRFPHIVDRVDKLIESNYAVPNAALADVRPTVPRAADAAAT